MDVLDVVEVPPPGLLAGGVRESPRVAGLAGVVAEHRDVEDGLGHRAGAGAVDVVAAEEVARAVPGGDDPVLVVLGAVGDVRVGQALDPGAVVVRRDPLAGGRVEHECRGVAAERHHHVVAGPAQVVLLLVGVVVVVGRPGCRRQVVRAGAVAPLDETGVVVPAVTDPGGLPVGDRGLSVDRLGAVGEGDLGFGAGRRLRDAHRVAPGEPAAAAARAPGAGGGEGGGLVRAARPGGGVGRGQHRGTATAGQGHRAQSLSGRGGRVDGRPDRARLRVVGARDGLCCAAVGNPRRGEEARGELLDLQPGGPLGAVQVLELLVVQLDVDRGRAFGRRRHLDDRAVQAGCLGRLAVLDLHRPGAGRGRGSRFGLGRGGLADLDGQGARLDQVRPVCRAERDGFGPARRRILPFRLVLGRRLGHVAGPAFQLRGLDLVELRPHVLLEARQLDADPVAGWCCPCLGGQKSGHQDHGERDPGARQVFARLPVSG